MAVEVEERFVIVCLTRQIQFHAPRSKPYLFVLYSSLSLRCSSYTISNSTDRQEQDGEPVVRNGVQDAC
jgi:hypothetical protein